MRNVLLVGGNSTISIALKPLLIETNTVYTAGRSNCDYYIDVDDASENYKLPNKLDVMVITTAHFGGKTVKAVYDAEKTNVLGAIKLCEAGIQKNVKHIVYISSILAVEDAWSENADIYSISKKHAEDVLIYLCKHNNINLTILRPSQIYGIGSKFVKHQPFLYSIIDKAKKNETVFLYGTKDPIRNYIYIDDVATIIAKVIHQNITGLYACTQVKNTSYCEIAEIAFKQFGTIGGIEFIKDKPNINDRDFEIDESLYKKINFYPLITIESGLNKIISSIYN